MRQSCKSTIPRNLTTILVLGVSLHAQDSRGTDSKHPSGSLARANNAFGCDLYRQLRSEKGNLFFSPYSISVALGMTRAGAAGKTAGEMDRVMHTTGLRTNEFPKLRGSLAPREIPQRRGKPPIPAFELHIANALWGQIGMKFEDPFLKTMLSDFVAPLQRVDFTQTEATRKRINRWVEDQTKDRIRDIVPPGLPTPDCRLALGNAIYFKASWAKPFSARATRPGPFTIAKKKDVEAEFMARTESLAYFQDDDVQVAEVPYRGGDSSMVVVLPRKLDGLAALEGKLSSVRLEKYTNGLRPRQVALKMPRFEFTLPLRLDETLRAMGIRLAFSSRADFSKMTKAERLMIGAVLHKAFVAVDEKGTEAAAATIVMMKRSGRPARRDAPVPMILNHPFVFFIRHRATGCILFLGRVTNPAAR